MFRRTVVRRVYEQFEGHISGDRGHMTLQQACTIFGFQLDEEWKKQDIKKRFQKLALKFHPDHGGSSEQFQMLKEAQHLLLTHRRDRASDRAPPGSKAEAGGGVNFRRMNYDNLTNTIHRQTADRPEYRSFSLQDFLVFLVFISCLGSYYLYSTYTTQMRVLKSRWSYSEEKIRDDYSGRTASETAWHPWMADSETRDRMDDIAILQGSVRRELVDAKRKETPPTYTPWQSGGPFARHMAPSHPPETTEGANSAVVGHEGQ
ncbi:hypothetical protein ABL78_2664 [Leptomonas seymouri]|uniref:J domain-containing protein n=1 Tax=Leptomonas seymouri TaxID=5684 RepID=A0A0N1ILG9_LEPSE|nr:hypothetical protein ABL78_2664 [Leptomonas seymouri]|eukprot:KPI88240.1 hypothetical protein ABL78_2664 [Leptomonas seymouri]